MTELHTACAMTLANQCLKSHSQAAGLLCEQACAYKQQSKADSTHRRQMNLQARQGDNTAASMPSTPPLPHNLFSLESLGHKTGIARRTFPITNCRLFSCAVEGGEAQPGANLAAGHTAGHLCVLPHLWMCVFVLRTIPISCVPKQHIPLLQHLVYPKLVLHHLSSA